MKRQQSAPMAHRKTLWLIVFIFTFSASVISNWLWFTHASMGRVHVAADGDHLPVQDEGSFLTGQAQTYWPTLGEWVHGFIASAFDSSVLMRDFLPMMSQLEENTHTSPLDTKGIKDISQHANNLDLSPMPFDSSSSMVNTAPVPLPYMFNLPDQPPPPAVKPLKALNIPKVLIYHTHNRESWLSVTKSKGRDDAMDDAINITLVGQAMADVLESAGIPVIHEDVDIFALLQKKNLPYSASYVVSREVVETMMKKTPHIQYLFDIHRDANPRSVTTTTINGQSYAKIMFVIGESNPNWQANMKLAEMLTERLEARYPGITRPVLRLTKTAWRNGEYNQSLSNDALTVEIGGHENTPEEAKRSAAILAEIFAEIYLEVVPVFQPVGGHES